ncbi:MAG: efflux RND transporter periplasmic adaptor subunit [Candidatus Rokubacteria bacterium]|nr:efflux RND transporter periplasmic adaptor subunit [Candidatus Rokubacteria bacterium]
MKRLVVLALIVLTVGGGVWAYFATQSRGNAARYRLARVERGPLTAAVSASGNLAAVTTVLVGSQVSGQITELFADFNSLVERGQVIARIDPEIFEAKVNQARAELDSAGASVLNQQAQVERARADVENARSAHAESRAQTAKAQVALLDARRDLERKDELFRRQLIAKSERDSAQAAHDSAAAQLDSVKAKEAALAAAIGSAAAQLRVAEAQLVAARAQVKQKEASLQQAQVDLEHTTIRAPVNGVVVSRQVDVGQTVAASLQAPTLFTIAQDLTKMQVETSVDEADIGRVKLADRATFTVDAFPGETFAGGVTQIRKAAQIVQNVVTYTVVVAVDNPGGKLLPGMTANVKLVVAEKPSVLKVPNAALRFRPSGAAGGASVAAGGAPARRAAGGSDAGAGAAGGGGQRPSMEQIRERLVKGLGLTEEQQKTLDPILADSRQQMIALRGAQLSDAERQGRMQKIREATRTRVRQILTAEQQRRYDEMSPPSRADAGAATGLPGRVWIVGPDGKPAPVSITLGLSDGTATEVLRGDLKEGQDVIIGTVSGAGGQSRPSGGPRLRL